MSQFVQFLDDQDVTGAIVITVAAIVAMVAVTGTLLHMFLVLTIPTYARGMSSAQERNFITSPLGFYIICLLASYFISAVGGVMESQWIGARAITEGPVCTAQAFTLQLGNNAAALWTAVIAISAMRTFLFRARSLSKLVTLLLIFLLWTAMAVFDGLASTIFSDHPKDIFYGIAGMWCWITPSHTMARLVTQYVWMWVWSAVSAVGFLLVFFSVRGNITVNWGPRGKNVKFSKRAFNSYALGNGHEQYGALVGTVGKTMCWFPISYITLTLPISVTRVSATFGFPVPAYAFTLSAVMFFLLGVATPAVYIALRHSLKHSSVEIGSNATLQGYSFRKGVDSFHTPGAVEKQFSGASPWTPVPTTREWVPPSPHHGIGEARSPASSTRTYTMTGEEDSLSISGSSTRSDAPLRPVPASAKAVHRQRSFHRPIANANTVTSINTVTRNGNLVVANVQLSPVSEGDSPTDPAVKSYLAVPARALAPEEPHMISSSELEKFSNVPLSPDLRPKHRRSPTDTSVYNGPRAISPNLDALLRIGHARSNSDASVYSQSPGATSPKVDELLQAGRMRSVSNASAVSSELMESPSTPLGSPTGPPPPPRKARRSPIPSVPVDVDEDDEGSICSARPSVEGFNTQASSEENRPTSIGDITARNPDPSKRVDSMRTFWAAYDDTSPRTPDMPKPASKHDTMATFWAAYEDPSPTSANMPMPSATGSWKHSTTTSPSSAKFSRGAPTISAKPSLSAVGGGHQRSGSVNPPVPMSTVTPGPAQLRPSHSATARYVAPSAPARAVASDTSYHVPRRPGYL